MKGVNIWLVGLDKVDGVWVEHNCRDTAIRPFPPPHPDKCPAGYTTFIDPVNPHSNIKLFPFRIGKVFPQCLFCGTFKVHLLSSLCHSGFGNIQRPSFFQIWSTHIIQPYILYIHNICYESHPGSLAQYHSLDIAWHFILRNRRISAFNMQESWFFKQDKAISTNTFIPIYQKQS